MRRKIRKGKMRLLLAVTFEFLAILAQISLFFFLAHAICFCATQLMIVWFGLVRWGFFRFFQVLCSYSGK